MKIRKLNGWFRATPFQETSRLHIMMVWHYIDSDSAEWSAHLQHLGVPLFNSRGQAEILPGRGNSNMVKYGNPPKFDDLPLIIQKIEFPLWLPFEYAKPVIISQTAEQLLESWLPCHETWLVLANPSFTIWRFCWENHRTKSWISSKPRLMTGGYIW